MSNSNLYTIIVAGGSGSRLKSKVAKQFLEIAGLPILMHTVNAFHKLDEEIQIILVLSQQDADYWQTLLVDYKFSIPHQVTLGGNSRFESVKNGLALLPDNGLVAIHDGVRPLVTSKMISTSFDVAKSKKSAVAAVMLKESIRKVDGYQTTALDRKMFRTIQTPQTFDISTIKNAYQIQYNEALTDDASVVESHGSVITLYEGDYENLKITTSEDLVIAEALLLKRKELNKK